MKAEKAARKARRKVKRGWRRKRAEKRAERRKAKAARKVRRIERVARRDIRFVSRALLIVGMIAYFVPASENIVPANALLLVAIGAIGWLAAEFIRR